MNNVTSQGRFLAWFEKTPGTQIVTGFIHITESSNVGILFKSLWEYVSKQL